MNSHEGRDTLHESPLMSALTKLPILFDSIDEAAEYMQKSHVDLIAIQPFPLGGCTFSYVISTNRSLVYFGCADGNSKKLVVGKTARRDLMPIDISDAERLSILKRNAHDSEQEEIALKTLKHNPYAGTYIHAITIEHPELTNGQNFIITEFISPGISLNEFVTNNEGSSIEDKADFAAAVGVQISACILELHQDMMIHREIKPDNVMLRYPDQEKGFVVMTDFNSVTHHEYLGLNFEPNHTTSAPELMISDIEWQALRSNKCDFYSIGATMYFMVLGEYPYAGETAEEVLSNMSRDPDSPRKNLEAAGAPAGLIRIIVKLLQLDPRLRYKHARLVINDLKVFLNKSAYAPLCGDVMLPEDSFDSIDPRTSGITQSQIRLTLSGPDASTPANVSRVTGTPLIHAPDYLTAEEEPVIADIKPAKKVEKLTQK